MKKGISFQIIVIFIVLIGWNLLHLGHKYQKNVFEDNISASPMMFLSMQENTLEQLKLKIEKNDFIRDIIIIQDSIVAQTLINNYNLGGSKNILSSYILPTAMQINFAGDKFQIEQKQELERVLLDYAPAVIYYFDNVRWQINQNKITLLAKSYYVGFGLFIILILFISIFLRIHFEIKSNVFWKIYRSSGGRFGKRRKQFLVNSLYLCSIPLILNVAIYYSLTYFQLLHIKIDYRIFGIELLSLVISSLFAGIVLGENLK
ncbi:MAG: hypothetical protein P9M11_00090 [Candidatus Tenebribacter burtonii]|nr:hypothetical protein [Candidatus Tenebribacter burtonii]